MVQIPKMMALIDYVQPFVDAQADVITFHLESLTAQQLEVFCDIQQYQKGLAINPSTPIENLLPFLSRIDRCLVMGVNPGFGGQTLILNTYKRIQLIRNYLDQNNLNCLIQVDGGVNDQTYQKCLDAGADLLVMGSYLFRNDLGTNFEFFRVWKVKF